MIPLILRLSNPYGPYHYSDKQGIVNVALRHAINNKPIQIWGDGSAEKDYIYIYDFVRILLTLMQHKHKNTIYNIASGYVLSVNAIIDAIKTFVPTIQCSYTKSNVNDVQHVTLSTKRLEDEIGHFKFTEFSEGLSKTYTWLLSQKIN